MDVAEINHELRSLESSPLKVADVMSQPVITVQAEENLG